MFPYFPLTPDLSCSGGDLQVWGASPHLLYQALQEWNVLMLRGCPPSPLLFKVPPSLPLLHAVR